MHLAPICLFHLIFVISITHGFKFNFNFRIYECIIKLKSLHFLKVKNMHFQGYPGPPRPAALLLDFVAREQGQIEASWLEISKSRSALRSQLKLLPDRESENETLNRDCVYKCPELGACIAASLWCDGHNHCPSGFDEFDCGTGARILGMLQSGMWVLVSALIGMMTAFACLLTILISR